MNTSGRLYRILRFDRAVQLFEKGELHFAHPSTWSDPYEVSLVHASSKQLFGQCWCTKGVSDAMWRIYSPDHLGVRISTSIKLLRLGLDQAVRRHNWSFRAEPVKYLSQYNITQEMRKIKADLSNSFRIERANDALFMKRDSFDHESEYRVIVTVPESTEEQVRKGLKVAVDPYKLIDSILLDPRAPDELSAALTYYFKEKVGFKKRVQKSVLYRAPTQVVVE